MSSKASGANTYGTNDDTSHRPLDVNVLESGASEFSWGRALRPPDSTTHRQAKAACIAVRVRRARGASAGSATQPAAPPGPAARQRSAVQVHPSFTLGG
jgi:hypothetical protein